MSEVTTIETTPQEAAAAETQALQSEGIAPATVEPQTQGEPTAEIPKGPDWERKLRKFEVRSALIEQHKGVDGKPTVGNHPVLSDDMSPEEWARVRNAQLADGIDHRANLEALREHERLQRQIDRETNQILTAEEARLAAERQQSGALTPDPAAVEAAVQARLEQQRHEAAVSEFHNGLVELEKERPEAVARAREVGKNIRLHPAVQEALTHVPFAAETAVELGAADAATIRQFLSLPVVEQIATVGRVSAAIEAEKQAPEQKPKPKPITPVRAGGSSSSAPREEDDADTWMQKRWQQVRASGRSV